MPRIERLVRGEPELAVAAGAGMVNDDQLRGEASPIDQIRGGRREPVARDQHAMPRERRRTPVPRAASSSARSPRQVAHGKQQLDYLGSGPVEELPGRRARRRAHACLSEAVRAFVERAKPSSRSPCTIASASPRVAPARRITSATRRSSPLRIEGHARGDERRDPLVDVRLLGRVQVAGALEDLAAARAASDRPSARHWPPGSTCRAGRARSSSEPVCETGGQDSCGAQRHRAALDRRRLGMDARAAGPHPRRFAPRAGDGTGP